MNKQKRIDFHFTPLVSQEKKTIKLNRYMPTCVHYGMKCKSQGCKQSMNTLHPYLRLERLTSYLDMLQHLSASFTEIDPDRQREEVLILLLLLWCMATLKHIMFSDIRERKINTRQCQVSLQYRQPKVGDRHVE